jgi:hypothetical protein
VPNPTPVPEGVQRWVWEQLQPRVTPGPSTAGNPNPATNPNPSTYPSPPGGVINWGEVVQQEEKYAPQGIGIAVVAGSLLALALAVGGCSFSPTTLVATPLGERMISTLRVGTTVLAYNPRTGKAERQTILHVWIDDDSDLVNVHLTLGSDVTMTVPDRSIMEETIQTTSNHPWLTTDRGWVAAGELQAGERVVREGGGSATVAGVQVVPGAAIRYNLEVSNDHTFAVGVGQYVVHNLCRYAF